MSKQVAYLTAFPADDVRMPLGEVSAALTNMKVLIEVVNDLADFHEMKVGSVDVAATRAALDRIKRLTWVVEDERARAEKALYSADDVAGAHIEYRVAA